MLLVDPELYSGVKNCVEGTTLTTSLLTYDTEMPFPPIVSSVWRRNGQNITDGNIETMGYNITFYNVTRQQSGVYILTVSNVVSSVMGNFTLDVFCKLHNQNTFIAWIIIDPPKGVDGPDVYYSLPGQTVHLVAVINITANPTMYFSIWTNTSDQPIMLNEESRCYSVPRLGELIINNATYDDNGTYGFAMTNGVSNNGYFLNVTDLIDDILNGSLLVNESANIFLTKTLELKFAGKQQL